MPTQFRIGALLTSSTLLAGCSLGPHYKAPQPAAVKFRGVDGNLLSEAPLDARWWGQFEDPVLDTLMDRALTANNTIRIARSRLAESRAVLHERQLNRVATVTVGGYYQYTTDQILVSGAHRQGINTFHPAFDAF